MNSALLTIGTEITSGEIVNTNAAWVSQRLEELGSRVIQHLSVRDNQSEILTALESLKNIPLLIITGGLGPTSDDMTRACVAKFLSVENQFSPPAWDELQARICAKGVTVRETHKHQCYFPAKSEVLNNVVGTAHGFYIETSAQKIFALPGPPKELEPMWLTHIEPKLQKLIPASSWRWFRWTCIGVPESQVAEAVEMAIEGTGLEVGYRAKPPNIFVKVFARPDQHQEVIKKIEATVSPWLTEPKKMTFD